MAETRGDNGRQSLIDWLTGRALAPAEAYAELTTEQLRDMVASGKRQIEIYEAMGLKDAALAEG